jgi:hypothetical protein
MLRRGFLVLFCEFLTAANDFGVEVSLKRELSFEPVVR